MSAGEIAARLGVTSGSVTVLVDRLVERGYVTRLSDPHDRRRVLVRLEPAAYAGFTRIYAPCGQAVAAATAALSERQRSADRAQDVRGWPPAETHRPLSPLAAAGRPRTGIIRASAEASQGQLRGGSKRATPTGR